MKGEDRQTRALPGGLTEETLNLLEFPEVCRILSALAATPVGKRQAQGLAPFDTVEEARQELETLRQCQAWMEEEGAPGFGLEEDPVAVLDRLAVEGSTVEFSEILVLTRLAALGAGFEESLRPCRERFPLLFAHVVHLPDFRAFAQEMNRKILPGGELADHASPELHRIRRQIEASRSRIQTILQEYLKNTDYGWQDDFITVRNDRYVLPVRRDHPKRLEGVVHGTSSSGATLFIEPMKTLGMNNQLIQLREQERAEMARIRLDICLRVHARLSEWRALAEEIGYLDLLTSKARFAKTFQGVLPELTGDGSFHFSEARHPLLVEQSLRSGMVVVPISLWMGEDRHVLILSGPNAGGKTVVLKTVGLLTLMGCCGLPVPALAARISFLHNIQVNIGDQQSIQENLSTFSAHLQALKGIMERVSLPALVLLDELGTGTDPEQGAALAIAVMEKLVAGGARVVVTTHYNRLKAYGYQNPGAVNMAVEFDRSAMRPTYRLLEGVAGSSSGLEIAARLGFPADVLAEASRMTDQADLHTDRYLEAIREKMIELEKAGVELGLQRQLAEEERENQRRELRRLRERLETERLEGLEQQARQFQSSAEKILHEIRDGAERDAARQKLRRRLDQVKTQTQKSIRPAPAGAAPAEGSGPYLPKAGDRVRISSLEQMGVVERVDLPFVEISIAGKRWRFHRSDLEPVAATPAEPLPRLEKRREIRSGVVMELESGGEIAAELTLIGCTGEEAVERTDKYLDQAVLAGHPRVRLIHGHGKGILRKVLQEFLRTHPHVAAVRSGKEDEGGQAATIVELRL